jgi:methionyl-tRNA synthetase
MLSFAYKCFDGHVPGPGELDYEDQALLTRVEGGFETVGALNSACKFRAAPGEALAREANVYPDRKAPWFQIKEDGQAAATTVYVTQSVRVVDNLKTILTGDQILTQVILNSESQGNCPAFSDSQGTKSWGLPIVSAGCIMALASEWIAHR